MLLILQATPTCLPASAPPHRSWPALLGPGPGLESKEDQATPLPYSGREEGVAELEAGPCICDLPFLLARMEPALPPRKPLPIEDSSLQVKWISLHMLNKGDSAALPTRRCFRKPRSGCSLLRKDCNQTGGPQAPGRTLPPTARGSHSPGRAPGRTDFQAGPAQSLEKRQKCPAEVGCWGPASRLCLGRRVPPLTSCDVSQQRPLA